MTIPLPPVLPRAVKLPTRTPGLKLPAVVSAGAGACALAVADLTTWGPYSALLRVGLAIPFLLPRPWWALTPPFHHHRGVPERTRNHGSLFSVALSLGLPPPGVTRHPSFMESGLSSGFPAVIQPSARGAAYAGAVVASTGKRAARSQAKPASTPSNPPSAQGRNRSRKAASRSASAATG